MALMRVTLNGQEVLARPGQTILELCREHHIPIPTLCHDDRLQPLGTCQICVVDVQGYGLVSSCATRVADRMVIQTHTPQILALRRDRLQALCAEHYGDCIAPCREACPAEVDIRGYIALIARGAYAEAVRLIKETLPLPEVIGRICPHPCENVCRRSLVDEPVAVCALKRFAAEHTYEELSVPVAEPTGFRVAIVGAGPAGLTAAYYLVQKGHAVTIFEALPEPGGMLRYGIPDYRLPKEILDKEIAAIARLGVQIRTGRALGRDFTLSSLFEEGYHAVYLAIGAHQSQRMNVEGEDLEGVLSGIDFLRAVACGQPPSMVGQRVAVIGGGNTAMDAARTAVRLGAEKVTVVYRRSRSEMPAMPWEVEEAGDEGIEFLYLAAPVRIVGENGRVRGIECVRMQLGEPDASGRRRPEPVPGSEFFLPVDTVIAAIGQRPDLSCLDGCALETRWGNISVDPETFQTSMPGVFAGGDCVTGAATAVEAIGAGRRAALAIHRYLLGEDGRPVQRVSFRKGSLEELRGRPEFAQVEPRPRQKMPLAPAETRRHNFQPVELGLSEEMALQEAARCLGCGCLVAETCTLRQYATEYGVSPTAPSRDVWYPLDTTHPFILRDPNKCIGCQRCARLCLEVQGVGALSIAYRVGTVEGYGGSLLNTPCESCGLCISGCPVGALVAKNELPPAYEVKTICSYCGVGCGPYLGVLGNRVVSARGDTENPVNQGLLCVKGRFGYEFIHHPDRLTRPLIRKNGELVEATWDEALDLIATRLAQYQGDAFAMITSAKCTNEENYVIQKFTRAVMGTNNIDHCARL